MSCPPASYWQPTTSPPNNQILNAPYACGFTASSGVATPVWPLLHCCGNNAQLHDADTCNFCGVPNPDSIGDYETTRKCIYDAADKAMQEDPSLAFSPFCTERPSLRAQSGGMTSMNASMSSNGSASASSSSAATLLPPSQTASSLPAASSSGLIVAYKDSVHVHIELIYAGFESSKDEMDTSRRPHPPLPFNLRYPRWSRGTKIFLTVLSALAVSYHFIHRYDYDAQIDENLPNLLYNPHWREPPPQHGNYSSKAIVAASISSENTTWIPDLLPDFDHYIYVNDDPNATLTIPNQRGRESSAYLTFIIDHYDNLPDYMLFIHGERHQWHNEDRMYDGLPTIRNLRLSHVDKVGYANLRCTWDVGCPGEIRPEPEAEKLWDPAWPWVYMPKLFAVAFEELFPGEKMPRTVGVPCCAQFAATKQAIRRRSRKQYVRFRKWLTQSDMDPGTTGRVFEYMWHSTSPPSLVLPSPPASSIARTPTLTTNAVLDPVILGRQPVHCPPVPQCMCDQFGLCDLPRCTKDRCPGRFKHLDFWVALPKNWPREGQGENGLPREGWWEEELRGWW
ncbi:MAG: hypothetical protein M1828_005739 [Chrysothrix sp. TS-e1954]|nr:MAG: hypothetical protein M1828_005739 [Chrysothrix sp. TS-e1954]